VRGEIRLAGSVAARLTEHACANPAEECCGLLAGTAGTISRSFRARNIANAPSTAYEIAPQELFKLMREIRGAGLELLGIYHSHPRGENVPSARDIERAYYPDAAYVIVLPRVDAPKPIRAFSIRDGRANELDIHIV
jgi:proteasome lid subunit RPN8/RPN11